MLRLAAISFLNPAPLLYDFEHAPRRDELAHRYAVHYTAPSRCARDLLHGDADLGLIPVASLTPQLAVVPGSTIASKREVRSILLLVKNPHHLAEDDALRWLRTIAADAASRSSQAYLRVMLAHFLGNTVARLVEQPADALAMLATADAALLIGDPALIARERRAQIDAGAGAPLLWIDIAALWHRFTALPWVAAVWAVRPAVLAGGEVTAARLIDDLDHSREAGLAHIDDLVAEWTPRVPVPATTIRTYLTSNIHYHLDRACLHAVETFRSLAAEHGILPALGPLPLLSRGAHA